MLFSNGNIAPENVHPVLTVNHPSLLSKHGPNSLLRILSKSGGYFSYLFFGWVKNPSFKSQKVLYTV